MKKPIIFDSDAWAEVYAAIRKNKLRTMLTMLGVAWGMFLFVALLGASKGVENGFEKNFGGTATNSLFVWMQQTAIPYQGFQRGRLLELKMDDLEALKQTFSQIKKIAPRSMQPGITAKFGTKYGKYSVYGDYPEQNVLFPRPIIQGRFINEDDIKYNRRVCVMGIDAVDELFPPDTDPIGKMIQMESGMYTVVGVYKMGAVQFGSNDDIHIPFTTFQQIFNRKGVVDFVIINIDEKVDIIEFEPYIKEFLKERKTVSPDDTQAIGGFNLGKEMKKLNSFLNGLQFLAIIVGILTLFSGVIAISSILLITVSERTKEFGIRRALGAVPAQIRSQILLESIVLTTIAGLSGIIFASLILYFVNFFTSQGDSDLPFINASVDVTTLTVALLIMVVMAVLAGMIPAQRAISIKPIDALRDE